MTEKEKLELLISEGFKTHMCVRTISDEEKLNRLPEPYWGKDVFAVPLWKGTGEKIMFYFVNDETIKYAENLVKKDKEIMGYDLCVYCSIVGSSSVNGQESNIRKIVESLSEIKKWDVKQSEYANVFEVYFKIDGDDKAVIKNYVNEVKSVALWLSLKNELGFSVIYYSPGPKFRAQPFSIKTGIPCSILKGIGKSDIKMIANISRSPECTQAAKALRLLYSQITSESKVIVGWSTIEEIFRSPPKHMLNENEINEVVKSVSKLEFSESKKNRVINMIKNPDLISEINRNDRIAKNIANTLGEEISEILPLVKSLSKARGKIAHTFDAKGVDLLSHIKFMEKTLLGYLGKHGVKVQA